MVKDVTAHPSLHRLRVSFSVPVRRGMRLGFQENEKVLLWGYGCFET